jgi:hypothetical protein
MGTFTFNGSSGTLIAGSGGFAQGWDGHSNSFSADASLGAGISVNGFHFSVRCPEGCDRFQEGDYITVQTVTVLLAVKTKVTWSICGGDCRGRLSYWTGGIGLGISGRLKFKFNP